MLYFGLWIIISWCSFHCLPLNYCLNSDPEIFSFSIFHSCGLVSCSFTIMFLVELPLDIHPIVTRRDPRLFFLSHVVLYFVSVLPLMVVLIDLAHVKYKCLLMSFIPLAAQLTLYWELISNSLLIPKIYSANKTATCHLLTDKPRDGSAFEELLFATKLMLSLVAEKVQPTCTSKE